MLIIKEIRNRKNMTIKELAVETGITERMIINYEAGKNDIGLNNLKKISLALGVTISELIEENPISPQTDTCHNPECIMKIARLERIIDDLLDDKNKLKQENDLLRTGGQSPGKRAQGDMGESSNRKAG